MPAELRGDWGSVVFYRAPGLLLAWPAILLAIPATAITATGLFLTFCLPIPALFLPPSAGLLTAMAMSVLVNILDCTDGPVARETGQASQAGAYLDFAVDVLHRGVLLTVIGHFADVASDNASATWLAAGIGSGFLATFARLNRSHMLSYHLPDDIKSGKPESNVITMIYGFLSGIDKLLPLFALPAWHWGMLDALLIWFFLYHGADAVIAVTGNYARLKSSDARKVKR
jgi:phosphatidylglycerophosphate synthase